MAKPSALKSIYCSTTLHCCLLGLLSHTSVPLVGIAMKKMKRNEIDSRVREFKRLMRLEVHKDGDQPVDFLESRTAVASVR
jgi:hypothetical protein